MLEKSILLLIIAGISYLLSRIIHSFELEASCKCKYRNVEKMLKILREVFELIALTLYFPSALFAIYIFIFK